MGEWQLERLGWRAFQDLTIMILSTIFGQSVESFEDGNDEGRDGSFTGVWKDPVGGESLYGNFVVQSKFSSGNGTMTLSSLRDELPKIKALHERGLCDNYILMTNLRVTGKANSAIREAVMKLGVPQVRVWGKTWIEQKLDDDAELRRRVPRVYGLGDLTEILDERSLRQGRAILSALGTNASTFVPTHPFYEAAKALDDHGAVLLIGQPTVGKSVIAQMLSLGVLDSKEAEVVVVTKADDFVASWSPSSYAKRLFWVDDVFGELTAEPALVGPWGRQMKALLAARDQGDRFIFTSRDYIYRDAVKELRSSAVSFWNDAQIAVSVSDLTESERRRILYNHLKLGAQPPEFRRTIKPYLEKIADLSGFTPGLANRLGSPRFTATIDPSVEESVVAFFQRPSDYLDEIISELPQRDRAALGVLFASKGTLDFPLPDPSGTSDLLSRLGGDLGNLARSLQALDGTFVRHETRGVSGSWSFAHPTIREATNRMLQASAVAVDAVLDGSRIEELVPQVDMRGSLPIRGTVDGRMLVLDNSASSKVIDRIVEKLNSAHFYQFQFEAEVVLALSERATPEIRKRFTSTAEDVVRKWATDAHHPSKAKLLGQMLSESILPEDARRTAVESLTTHAAQLRSMSWASVDWITETEKEAIVDAIATSIRDPSSVLEQILNDYDVTNNPEWHVEDHFSTLDALKDIEWARDGLAGRLAVYEEKLYQCFDELMDISEYGRDYDRDDFERDRDRDWEDPEEVGPSRSIFDDVDE